MTEDGVIWDIVSKAFDKAEGAVIFDLQKAHEGRFIRKL
jgi:hypothetical protein